MGRNWKFRQIHNRTVQWKVLWSTETDDLNMMRVRNRPEKLIHSQFIADKCIYTKFLQASNRQRLWRRKEKIATHKKTPSLFVIWRYSVTATTKLAHLYIKNHNIYIMLRVTWVFKPEIDVALTRSVQVLNRNKRRRFKQLPKNSTANFQISSGFKVAALS